MEINRENKKASQLRFYWIALMSGIYTVWGSLKVILASYFSKNLRRVVDQSMFLWSQQLLGLLRLKVNVEGLDNLPRDGKRPVIVMCNHSSLYDIPVSALALKTSLRMVAKKELFKIPIFGHALRRGEYLPIDRHNRTQSARDLKIAREKLLSGIILWIAPEGTRSKDGQLGAFKRGGFQIAIDSEALIVPLAIKGISQVQAGDNLDLYLDQTIEVELCEPVDAVAFGVERRAELIQEVRNRILEKLNPQEQKHE